MTDDTSLIQRLIEREPTAWAEFLDLYGDLVYSTVYHTLRRSSFRVAEDRIDDIVQGIFERLLEKDSRALRSYEGRGCHGLASWLRTVTTNFVYDFIRAQKGNVPLQHLQEGDLHQALERHQPEEPRNVRDSILDSEQMDMIGEVLQILSSRDRLVFRLYYSDELTRNDVADLLNLEPNNVDQILFRIRKTIRERILETRPRT